MTDNQTTAPPQPKQLPPMTGSKRVALARDRKRKDIVFVGIEIMPSERDALIRIGLLNKADRNNKIAVREALYGYLDGFLNFQMAPRSNGEFVTMTDVHGTQGKGPAPDDLSLIYLGGEGFIERLKQFAAGKKQHDDALAELRLGQNVQAALDEAQRKLADADALQKQAAKTLADAKAKAAAQIAEADQIVANAKAQQAEAHKRLKQADARERAVAEVYANAERAELMQTACEMTCVARSSIYALRFAKSLLPKHELITRSLYMVWVWGPASLANDTVVDARSPLPAAALKTS